MKYYWEKGEAVCSLRCVTAMPSSSRHARRIDHKGDLHKGMRVKMSMSLWLFVERVWLEGQARCWSQPCGRVYSVPVTSWAKSCSYVADFATQ